MKKKEHTSWHDSLAELATFLALSAMELAFSYGTTLHNISIYEWIHAYLYSPFPILDLDFKPNLALFDLREKIIKIIGKR